jgi:hypothetical protein
VVDPERAAAEALAAEKHQVYLLYSRKKYDRIRERILAKRKAKYEPAGRPVSRPKLPRE